MIKRRIVGCQLELAAPEALPEGSFEVSKLPVRVSIHNGIPVYYSAWEPTPKELEVLNQGGSVVLCCLGGQPPVALTVETQDGEPAEG